MSAEDLVQAALARAAERTKRVAELNAAGLDENGGILDEIEDANKRPVLRVC